MGKCWLAGEQSKLFSQQKVVAETSSAVQTAASVMQAEKRAAQDES